MTLPSPSPILPLQTFMPQSRRPARILVFPVGVTVACDLSCAWCANCRGPDQPSNATPPPELPNDRPIVIRLVGGDPFGRADLARWGEWARGYPRARLEVEGPGHSLADPAVVERLRALQPEIVRVSLPALDASDLLAWTGRADLADKTLAGIAALAAAGLAVHVLVPINRLTVTRLAETVLGVAERFGAGVPIVLQRAPLRARGGTRTIDATDPLQWSEVDALGRALASLPSPLPGDAPMWFDDGADYAACLLPEAAWRPQLMSVAPTLGDRAADTFPDAARCGACAFSRHCNFRLMDGEAAPLAHMKPLDDTAARLLQSQSTTVDIAGATQEKVDRKAYDLPELLCFAPWTTLTLYSRLHMPVPCAPAWVDTKMGAVETSRELKASLLRVVWNDLKTKRQSGVKYFDPTNEDWHLADMWNGPMYRQMRREMAPGGASHRCRASCRVILGVEERGVRFFTIPDLDLAPSVAENRRRLVEEVRAGKSVLESTPLELTMGVSAHCNFTCSFCSGPQGSYGELSERRLEEVIRWLPGLMQLTIVGPGEPLMSVTFKKLMEEIATREFPSLTVSLTTNGTLARPSWIKRHANVRWGQIRFSINAGSAATHERMTGKKLFDQLIENVEAVVALRDSRNPPFNFTLSCVLSQLIVDDLHRYAELVDKYRAVPVLEPMTGSDNDLSPYTSEERTRRLMEECNAVARDYQHRNPQLYAAFEAMGRFAESRLQAQIFTPLPQL